MRSDRNDSEKLQQSSWSGIFTIHIFLKVKEHGCVILDSPTVRNGEANNAVGRV